MRRLRSSEWLVVGYFVYAAIVGTVFHIGFGPWVMAGAIGAVIFVLARRKSVWRDIAPLPYTFCAYREMDWFSSAVHDHHLEHAWIVWDRWLLDDLHLRALVESLGQLFPSYFELCYLMVYGVAAVSIGLLFHFHRRDQMNRFWIAYLAGTLGAYALFPYFPSEPPRLVFADADLPHVLSWVRRVNLLILGGYGIHSSVFPSAHVSSALSAAWGLLAVFPDRRWIGWVMAFYGLSVAWATIYGRYHYAADAAAGIAISLLAVAALKLDKAI